FEGCWKIFSSRQYLNHHMKYQHVHQKTFSCSHPSCGKSFNFKKHLKEHEKLHSDRRDYICEFCARAFRTSSNLSIHRRIHTGEKPLQCEVCGFTCRQKASLNWHMRKHNAERNYHFPCNVCGRRFEKRDNVTAHRSKSHPELPAPCTDTPRPLSLTPELPAPCTDMPRPLSPSPELPAPHHLAPAQLPPSAPGTGWKRSKFVLCFVFCFYVTPHRWILNAEYCGIFLKLT
uniref:C2H2-type domain-containing protein n=1 Tax=Electrophorus electricus TaxID=8005 RepID=A0AAY5EQ15_ELEEL